MPNLSGKIALVTGASRGIGAAIAERLAREGAHVVITYSASKEKADAMVAALQKEGVKAAALLADANQPATMPELVERVVKEWGGIDILVNNAGVWSMGNIGEVPMEEYERVRRVNVDSVFALTNAAVRHMKPGSRIINISSGLGERASGPMMSTYTASKFAVTGFTRGWAKDLGAKGILVNAVLPGPIDTDMNPASGPFAEFQKAQTALGRYGHAEEIAGAVAFLAGPDASYITGAHLNVDGGWNA